MAFVHELSNEHFATQEEAIDDLLQCLELEDLVDAGNFNEYEIVRQFVRRKNDESFCNWLQELISTATDNCIESMINEIDDEEDAE